MLQLNEIGSYLITDLSVIQGLCSGIRGVKCEMSETRPRGICFLLVYSFC